MNGSELLVYIYPHISCFCFVCLSPYITSRFLPFGVVIVSLKVKFGDSIGLSDEEFQFKLVLVKLHYHNLLNISLFSYILLLYGETPGLGYFVCELSLSSYIYIYIYIYHSKSNKV